MNEDTIRLATIGRMLHRRWRLLAVLTVVGALVGLGAAAVFPPSYTTSASVLLPGQWEERELLTQVDIATSGTVLDRTAVELGWTRVSGDELRGKVTAKASDGNIIKISGTSDTPEHAQRLADQAAKEFVTFAVRIAGGSNGSDATTGLAALRKQVEDTNRRISELSKSADPGKTVEGVQARTSLEKLTTSLEEAMTKLAEADPANVKAGMVVMGPAARPTGEAPPTRIQLVVAGALVFFLVAVVCHLAAARVNRRPRSEREIAAALGSALLGIVDVPDDRHAHLPEAGSAQARLRRLLRVDTRWDAPIPQRAVDTAAGRIGYRRVCARLRDQLPAHQELLAVVPEGDAIARRAAGQLTAEAPGDLVLRTVEVSADRPMVPDRTSESGALVVLSAGTWTTTELNGIAQACADAGHEVVGVVVSDPVLSRPSPSAGHPLDQVNPASSVRSHATGGPA
ncbi:Wzz/FepE/Etk N-terminal domain-containing protein [Streptomyces sp. NBC_01465]|uniref:Wzz/FepE/Etk N-terminal domain-containing protein n=1 Tax=Streptomyces sp. NBC_01465 TaxID=2903878 RepID=UPI002E37ED7A|nr:Wzz/FepE/Etk N-terminal domain-containing protein [Streptomyces sp. NBC_01465]